MLGTMFCTDASCKPPDRQTGGDKPSGASHFALLLGVVLSLLHTSTSFALGTWRTFPGPITWPQSQSWWPNPCPSPDPGQVLTWAGPLGTGTTVCGFSAGTVRGAGAGGRSVPPDALAVAVLALALSLSLLQ